MKNIICILALRALLAFSLYMSFANYLTAQPLKLTLYDPTKPVQGLKLNKAIPTYKRTKKNFEVLKHNEDNSFYYIAYELSPNGLQSCVEKCMQLVAMNKKVFDEPSVIQENKISSFANGVHDYMGMFLTLTTGETKYARSWTLDNAYAITLSLSQMGYYILINPPTVLKMH